RSFLDALGNSIGFTIALLLMSAVRELLGYGSLLGFNLLGPSFEPWVIMILPPGGFFTLGFYLLLFGWWKERQARSTGNARLRAWPHDVTRQHSSAAEEVPV
ncbi:MAG TPA: Rnf-Nqr domain containing protein, partial [Longimicrobiales bacterium]|nr:Rnf-Nqr domain containing protein [Longimicrobiales bacterium]